MEKNNMLIIYATNKIGVGIRKPTII
jgi:hypothetical protein